MTTTLIQSEITTLNNDIDIMEARLKKLKTQKKYEEEIHDVFDKGGTPEKLRIIMNMCKECDFHKNKYDIYKISKNKSMSQRSAYYEASKVYAITYPMFECLLDIVHKQDIRIKHLEQQIHTL
tara:strand:+ start:100 stop:468 length:369 start_codon:yes stop_codon:yes gene_type:complete